MSTDAIGKLCSTPLRKEKKKLQTPISFALCKWISRVSSQREIESLTHQRLYIQFFDVDEVICQVGNSAGEYELLGLDSEPVRNHKVELVWETCKTMCKVLLLRVHED